jgi:hypothetical protein
MKPHRCQVPQAQLVAQSPEHHEGDDIARVLRPVKHIGAAFVELLDTDSGTGGNPVPSAQVVHGYPSTHMLDSASPSLPPIEADFVAFAAWRKV